MKAKEIAKLLIAPSSNNKSGTPTQVEEMQELSDEQRYPEKDRKVLYKWEARTNPVQTQLNNRATRTYIVMGIVISIVLVAMQEFLLIFAILSLIFVKYILSKTPTKIVSYELTNHGLMYDSKLYYWYKFKHFFISGLGGNDVFVLDLKNEMPGRIYLTINQQDKDKIKTIIEEYVFYLKEEPKTFVDKSYDFLMSKINLE